MGLDSVFLYFLTKLEAVCAPRSVAEAGITASEVEFLRQWFADQYGKPRNWCDRTWQEQVEGDVTASSQEMFGALFLIHAAETCRDQCNEESVWPAVRAVFKANKSTYDVLFDGSGQPTTACKDAMAAGVRKLKCRNVIDRCGTQEYFETVKLQIGFTRKGAAKRLPEWLDGQGPTAVQILNGSKFDFGELKLESESFAKVWKTLQDYRHSRVSGEYTSLVLASSPWVRPAWVPDLLRAARLRPNRTAVSVVQTEPASEIVEPLCEPILRWNYPDKPCLILQLNEERINDLLLERGVDAAAFAIDWQIVDRWTMQEGGVWRGRRELPCQPEGARRSNLRPRTLSVSSGDTPVIEVDLSAEAEIGEPLLVFDLGTGRQIDPSAKLDPNGAYALLCDPDMEVPNARSLKGKDRSAFLLSRPLAPDTQVLCSGVPYWRPRLGELPIKRSIRLTVECPPGGIVDVGSASQLLVRGVPDDAAAVSLVAGNQTHHMLREGENWRTQYPMKVPLAMALGDERVRVRVEGDDYARIVVPKLSLSLRGIAVMEMDGEAGSEPEWKLLNRQRPLNRAAGAGKARVFVENWESELYEGFYLVHKATSRALDLRDLHGWGSPLIARARGVPELTLVQSVEDQGCVGLFLHELLGKSLNTIYRRTPQPPSSDHAVLVWPDIDKPPHEIRGQDIRSEDDGFVWKLPDLPQVAALAVAYKGSCLGAYWNSSLISAALRRPLSAKTVSLIRWLKLPVLSPAFRPPIQEAVSRTPVEFLRGWLNPASLPRSLSHRPAEQGLDTVIRAFLWNHIERSENRINELIRAFERPTPDAAAGGEAEQFKRALLHVGEICPALAYGFAKIRARGEKYRKCVRNAVSEALGLGQPSRDLPQLRGALAAPGWNCAGLVGITQEELIGAVDSYERYLDGRTSERRGEDDLRRLGERKIGRQYLTASLLLKLLERTGA